MTTSTASEPETVALPARRDKPVTLLHRVEYTVVLLLTGLFRLIGVDAASWLAGTFARYVGPLIRPVSRKAERNLKLIYPHWTTSTIRAVTRDVWENAGRTAGEFPHLRYLRDFEQNDRVDIIGKDMLDAITARSRPVILFSAHFANWELMPSIAQQAGLNYALVYRAANNPLTDELIINHRGLVMSRHQIPKDRGARALVETLQQGRSLALLVDQKLNTGISVPFMGVPAMTAPAAARLSLKYKAPLIQASLVRLKGARFQLTVHEPLAFTPSGDMAADVEALTLQINQALETDIRAHPGQWLWFHRRWPKDAY
ncbi:lysophospholipid acyltransferase family protein [Hyphococcus sp.]|uniref:lysophospholipid acyltransferase family protein n=1 Tax=Hyphococcus sp. TaxID=2038636 RepID=UPI002084480E|nr:MAG: lipid A biosynthesis lauroyl acyltransferase [Marinicaulis sp.]